MNFTKKIASLLLGLCFIALPVSSDTIYETVKNTEIAHGVVHSYIQRMTSDGWKKINLLTVDLTNDDVHLKALHDERGISYRSTLTSLLQQCGAIAGTNADFFDLTTPAGRTSPLGLTANEGEIISSPAHDTALASLVETDDGVFTGYFQMQLELVADNGNKADILHINKYHPTDSIVMFTTAWGEYTDAVNDGSRDMIIENDKVIDIITNSQGTKIPENGCVLRVNPAINNFFEENFSVGDHAQLTLEILPDNPEIKTAVGGGTILVSDGSIAEFTNNVSGSHPRTAAGVSQDGGTLYLVTVEGREKNTSGMTQTQLARLMISLGAYNAINFDGGGSTEMAATDDSGNIQILNTPSDGSERRISTGVGVSVGNGNGYFASMRLQASQENLCIGDGVEIWCFPHDNYGNPIDLPYELEFSSNAGGYFEGNKYYPQYAGPNIVTVTAGEVSQKITVNVISEIANLTFYPTSFSGDSAYLSVVAADSNGIKSQISPSAVKFEIAQGNGTVDTGGNVSCDGAVTVSASFGGKIAYCNGNMPYALTEKIHDSLLGTVNDPSFVIMPKKLDGNTFINCVTNRFLEEAAAKFSTVFTFGNYQSDTIYLSGLYEDYSDSCAFVSINNSDTVFSGNGEQWSTLVRMKDCDQKNVFIFLTNGNNFSDSAEQEMFSSILSDYYVNGKRVFVIYAGETNDIDIENGIRFITLKNIPQVTLDNFENSMKDADFLKFYTDGDSVTYEFAQIIK